MDEIWRWGLPIVLLAVSVGCAFSNLDNLFGWTKGMRAVHARGQRVSPAMFVGGVTGAVALWIWPDPDLKIWAWLPFLVDFPGTLGIGRAPPAPEPGSPAAEALARESGEEARRVEEDRKRRLSRGAILERAAIGCLLGTAVGDALGLAAEGLSPGRQAKLFRDPSRYHLLPFGRGMCSDDTEHAVMLAQSVSEATPWAFDTEGHAGRVRTLFAWRLRFWLLGLPAGIGMATLKGIVKLWLFPPERWCGVNSAGNAPVMRAPILGACYGGDEPRLRALVSASTRLTHTDPKAERAAFAVAIATHLSIGGNGRVDVDALLAALPEDGDAELAGLLARLRQSVLAGESTPAFARALGFERGVTGYAYHTLPVALHAVLANPADLRGALLAAIACGGDTDTVAAIVGGILGAGVGREGIPPEWLGRLAEWPRTVSWMAHLGTVLAGNVAGTEVRATPTVSAIALLTRNTVFLGVVLLHGFRRLLPPY